MNCQECRNLFDDMLDRRIKEPLKRRMLNHLANSPTVLLRNVAVRNRGGRALPCRNGRLLPRHLW